MSYYGGTITNAGRDIIGTILMGGTLELSKIVVGSGVLSEEVDPKELTELIAPVAEGTSGAPMYKNGILDLIVEYRNDLNGGLKESFWLNEFGIFAKDVRGEEVLFYYASLGDTPQPVSAYQENRIEIKRYPVSITLNILGEVEVVYNPGAFVTAGEVSSMVGGVVGEAMTELGTTIVGDLTIPAEGWITDVNAGANEAYTLYIDVPYVPATESHYPEIAIHKDCLTIAKKANICPTVQTNDGFIRFWSQKVPEEEIRVTASLFVSTDLTIDESVRIASAWMDETLLTIIGEVD